MNSRLLPYILFLPALLLYVCDPPSQNTEERAPPSRPRHFLETSDLPAGSTRDTETSDSTAVQLLTSVEVYSDRTCSQSFEEVLADWSAKQISLAAFADRNRPGRKGCVWTRLELQNSGALSRRRVFYFPKGWKELTCYVPLSNGRYEEKNIGIHHGREVVSLAVPPRDTLAVYVRYPGPAAAYQPVYRVREMEEETYFRLGSRAHLKFLFLGVLIFPVLFFLATFLVERDRLSFYYLVFLMGAAAYMVTIVNTVPYFELTPKLISSIGAIQRLFVVATFLTLTGLVKYIHYLLDVASWSQPLFMAGNIFIAGMAGIALLPIIRPSLFEPEHYPGYLQYLRVWALLLFLYIILTCLWAVWRKVKFSGILLLAFAPFILSGVYYAVSFILLEHYSRSSIESFVLIVGFFFTLLLFGIVLGVRNNSVKEEKLRLEEKAERLRELDRFKSRFYTNITHEFRTPLTVIKGMAGQLKGQEKAKTLIQRNSDRLLQMVNQLLDLSRLETNSLPVHWVQTDVIPYLNYLTESCHSLAGDKKINLAFFASEELLVMDFDEEKLQQILLNLISNAIRYTPVYGSVKVVAGRVLESGTPYLELVVQDTGRGIAEEQLPRIFERFYRVDEMPAGAGEGAGIGLALVKELVQLLEGRIEVESAPGKGTLFRVLLPIHQRAPEKESPDWKTSVAAAQAGGSSAAPDPEAPPSGEGEGPLVLIIEDNADVVEYLSLCLADRYRLLTARNGQEGLERALEHIPDVVLCDVMMPELDGFETCRRLKEDRRTSHIPIILLTARATQENKVKGLTHGADAYLTKPFDKKELLVRLENLAALSQRLKDRLTASEASAEPSSESEQREAAFLREVDQIIADNLHREEFNSYRLCRAVAMSRAQLHRKLKALTGWSTAAYIRMVRLRQAKSLLETTDLPVGEIALQVGFRSFSHFSRSFAKEFGISPSETRK